MGDGVTLVSSADETAKDVYRVLADSDALRPPDLPPPSHGFTTTGDATEFTRLARRFLGPEVGADSDEVFGNAVVRSVAAPLPPVTPTTAAAR
jgi:glutamate racemase